MTTPRRHLVRPAPAAPPTDPRQQRRIQKVRADLEQEQQRVARRFEEAVQLAEQAFLSEFGKLVSHLAERLTGGDGNEPRIFRDSAVTNLRDFFEKFRTLNVRSNPELDALVEDAMQLVRGVTPRDLRDNGTLRQQVAEEMARVQTQVGALMVERPRRQLVRPNAARNGGGNGPTD
jgi:hypothetical protein